MYYSEKDNSDYKDHCLFKVYERHPKETDRCCKCGSESIRYSYEDGLFCYECQSITDLDVQSFTEWCEANNIDHTDLNVVYIDEHSKNLIQEMISGLTADSPEIIIRGANANV